MARLLLALAVLLMLICARPADAGTWHPIKQWAWLIAAQGDNGVVAYFDANSLRRVGKSGVRVWTKYRFSTPQSNPFGPPYVEADELENFDCSAQTETALSLTWYTSKGDVAASNEDKANPIHIVPGTVMAGLFNAVCRWAMK